VSAALRDVEAAGLVAAVDSSRCLLAMQMLAGEVVTMVLLHVVVHR
jgi:hypothetical protein